MQIDKNNLNFPLITVITISYNAEQEIVNTIKSVLDQTYTNVEYIVIDGNSTDQTVSLIKKYEKHITYWISENDEGIYDAMHKGIAYAQGEWVIFMNAGDVFYDNKVIETVFKRYYSDDIWFIYGDVVIDYDQFVKKKYAGKLEKIAYGMQFSHQSVFTRKNYLIEHKFNIKNTIGADFQFFFYAIKKYKKHFYYIPIIVSKVTNGGVSDKKRLQVLIGCWKVVGFRSLKINSYYLLRIIKETIKIIIKIIIGKKNTNRIIEKL